MRSRESEAITLTRANGRANGAGDRATVTHLASVAARRHDLELPDAVRRIADRVGAEADDLASAMVERYRTEILDYQLLDDDVLDGDVRSVSLQHLRIFLANLFADGRSIADASGKARALGSRRAHQVGLDSLLHAYRIWEQVVCEAVTRSVDPHSPDESDAALRIARLVMQHADDLATVAAKGYRDELARVPHDRQMVARDVVEALLVRGPKDDGVRRRFARQGISLGERYIAIVLRSVSPQHDEFNPSNDDLDPVLLRACLDSTKELLVPSSQSLVIGPVHGALVALYPVDDAGELERVREQCNALGHALADHPIAIGVGGLHRQSISKSYGEAKRASDIAAASGSSGRVRIFCDLLVDQMLGADAEVQQALAAVLDAVDEYDVAHSVDLLASLGAYFRAGFNLTRAASTLCVQPNTVVYRLKRIRQLTGRDPGNPEDLLMLVLAWKIRHSTPGEHA